MKRKHPIWFLLPLAFLLSLAACSSQAPAADAPQEAAAYTVAPYTPTEQEQTLLQAYELTQDNTVAFTFQNPEEILGLFVQIYRLGEDGTWQNVDDIAVGSLHIYKKKFDMNAIKELILRNNLDRPLGEGSETYYEISW